MIGIVDYGLGNVLAFASMYRRLGVACSIVSSPEDLYKVDKIILPGVGAFDWAMGRLEESGFIRVLNELVLNRGVPILGVCVGMQVMARGSQEGKLQGLGWIAGEVRRIGDVGRERDLKRIRPSKLGEIQRRNRLILPHMGWNDVTPCRNDCLFRGMQEPIRCYFLHSYYFAPEREEDIIAMTEYGSPFACAVRHNNIFGVQFHPEKSHGWGAQIVRNFAEL